MYFGNLPNESLPPLEGFRPLDLTPGSVSLSLSFPSPRFRSHSSSLTHSTLSSFLVPPPGPLYTPTSTPLLPSPLPPSEIVLFVGSPGSGKSHFYRTFFEKEGYVRVNQDELGTRQKCLKRVEELVSFGKGGELGGRKRVVVGEFATRRERDA